ncbi:MAG: hypothetical protein ACKOEM_00830, partial [Planctomycetia bacterium]
MADVMNMTATPIFPGLTPVKSLLQFVFKVVATVASLMLGGMCPVGAEEIEPLQFIEPDGQGESVTGLEIPSPLSTGEIISGGETIISDRAVGEPLPVLSAGDAVAEPIVSTSARAVDGLRLDDLTLDEMPFEASSGDWFSSGRWYGSAEMVWFDRSRNY